MLEMEIIKPNILEMELSGQAPSTIGGTTNYNELSGKPKINGVELKGDKTLDELNIASKDYVEQEIATFDFIKIVSELPEQGLINRTYLVTKKENATENDLYDEYLWVNKGTEEEPNWDWEYQGTKTIEVDLTNYVKNTDYANNNKYGVVKTNNTYGIQTENGSLYIRRATEPEIKSRGNQWAPITPANLDYAVKKGITTNSLEWSEEEKTSARNVINAVGKNDIANGTTPGLCTIAYNKYTSGLDIDKSGMISISPATEEQIGAKSSRVQPIVPANLDYAIKSGLSANKLEWTKEEQESARDLLGVTDLIGDIETALDELHNYAQALINGGVE